MRKQGTWGTDAEIMAAVTLFGIDIRVFYRGGDPWEWHTHEPLFAFQLPIEVAVDRIELVNYDRQHYDLVVFVWLCKSPRRSAGSRRLCTITTFLNEKNWWIWETASWQV